LPSKRASVHRFYLIFRYRAVEIKRISVGISELTCLRKDRQFEKKKRDPEIKNTATHFVFHIKRNTFLT